MNMPLSTAMLIQPIILDGEEGTGRTMQPQQLRGQYTDQYLDLPTQMVTLIRETGRPEQPCQLGPWLQVILIVR